MIFVADTSPINYLILLGHIDILPRIYGIVVVPKAVFDEMQDRDTPSAVRTWLSAPPPWFKVSNAIHRPDQPDRMLDPLDRGERDAIFLAESIGARAADY